jgi:opacity protein-like surface antigen
VLESRALCLGTTFIFQEKIMSKLVLPTLLALAMASMTAQADTENSNGFYVGGGLSALKLKSDDDEIKDLNFKNGIIQIGYQFSENLFIEGQYTSSLQSKSAIELNQEFDFTPFAIDDLQNLGTLSNTQIADLNSVKVNINASAKVSVDTAAIYAVYKTSGDLYAKIKGGPVSIRTQAKPQAKTTWNANLAANASPIIKEYLKAAESDFNESFYKSFNESAGGKQSERDSKFAIGVGAGYKIRRNISIELEYVQMGEDVATTSLTANYYF